MKKFLLLLGLILFSLCTYFLITEKREVKEVGRKVLLGPEKGTGLWYFDGVPDTNPNEDFSPELSWSTKNEGGLYTWNRTFGRWERFGQIRYGYGGPVENPDGYMGYFSMDSGRWYRWTGQAWKELGGVEIDPASSPILTKDVEGLKIDFSNLLPSETDNLAESIAESETAKEILKDSIFITANGLKDSVLINPQGQDIETSYLGNTPNFQGNDGAFSMLVSNGSKLKSFCIGGGSNDNIWDSSGEFSLEISGISDYANIQLVALSNGEVIMNPKQLGVSIFQNPTMEGMLIKINNLQSFGAAGLKINAKY